MPKLKILYTIPNFDTAGSGKVLYDLAKNLNPDYFEVSIVCKHNKGAFFKTVEALGFPIYFLDSSVPLRPYYSLISRINPFKKFVKEHQFDVVHSWHWSSDWSEALASRLGGAQFVYTKKAMSWGAIHWRIKGYLASFIITVNSDMKSFYPKKKQQALIPFGLDTAFYSPVTSNFHSKNKGFKIVTIAHLVPVKRVDTLLKALENLKNSSVSLDVIGDNTTAYAEELRSLVEQFGLKNQVRFLGKQSDVRPFLEQADLYIISSEKEGMPMALVEAMSMGVPVLGSDVPGIRYVLRSFDDLLYPFGDVNFLSQRIKEIQQLDHQKRFELGKRLRHYCEENFSLSQFIKSHERLYRELAKPS